MKHLKVYEPPAMFQIKHIEKPFLGWGGKIWFVQTLNGVYQLHVGVFDTQRHILNVWKSRDIVPLRKVVFIGWKKYPRNAILDESIYHTTISVPFLQKSA